MRFCYVWEKCTASAHHPSNLGNKAVPCWDTFSVPRYLFSLFRMRRPTTTSYRPILPAAIMLRAFLRLWGFIAVLHLREFEMWKFQIHGGFFMYYNTKASGARIRELRIAKNLTQDEPAEHSPGVWRSGADPGGIRGNPQA